jgi:hypothetical protein
MLEASSLRLDPWKGAVASDTTTVPRPGVCPGRACAPATPPFGTKRQESAQKTCRFPPIGGAVNHAVEPGRRPRAQLPSATPRTDRAGSQRTPRRAPAPWRRAPPGAAALVADHRQPATEGVAEGEPARDHRTLAAWSRIERPQTRGCSSAADVCVRLHRAARGPQRREDLTILTRSVSLLADVVSWNEGVGPTKAGTTANRQAGPTRHRQRRRRQADG